MIHQPAQPSPAHLTLHLQTSHLCLYLSPPPPPHPALDLTRGLTEVKFINVNGGQRERLRQIKLCFERKF